MQAFSVKALFRFALCASLGLFLVQCQRQKAPPSTKNGASEQKSSASANGTRTAPHPQRVPRQRRSKPAHKSQKAQVVPLNKYFTKVQTFAFIIPHLKPLKAVGVPRASACRTCHTEIYDEWKRSTHAAALRDLQYQAELSKSSSPKWLCLNCHTPVQNQRKSIIKGLKKGNVFHPAKIPNPNYDPMMQQEAITCATCHVRQDAKGESVVIGAIGSPYAPHPVRKDPSFLGKVCLRCHDPKGKRLTRHLLCWFKTREELAGGPFGNKEDCVSCHMPTTKRHLVASWYVTNIKKTKGFDIPKRTSHMHHWVGGGVPKSFAGYKHLRQRGYKPGTTIKLSSLGTIKEGQPISFTLSIQNTHSGHWMPSADPERFVLMLAQLQDAKGKRLAQKKLRIGQLWKWEPQAQKIGDNRLKPLETRHWKPTITSPKSIKGHKLVLLVYHVRLSSATARYMKSHAPKSNYLVAPIKKKLANMGKHYPLATMLYREEIDLATGKRKRATLGELLKLSYEERNKPLDKRDY